MAKVRVYEIAKELNVSNKEIIDFLSGHNVEVKSHSSTLEEDAVSLIRGHYSKKTPAPQTAAEVKPEGEEKRERPKKKATISAVYNPQNSKSGDRRGHNSRGNQTRVTNEQRPAGGQQRAAGDRPVRPAGGQQRAAGDRPVRPAGGQQRAAGDRPVRPAGGQQRQAGDHPVQT
ncbi:MAG: translation initiation factor IF-2 N-terminal domain-containing protein, partial [Clostridiales bacterium]|nr:translation initiation factor IF-2 N-terminal domain-containing protein [Clostridiales bacterium]